MTKTMTNEIACILDRVARKTGMDCWFCLRYTEKSGWYVFDLENREHISVTKAIKDFYDGIVPPLNQYITKKEAIILNDFLIKMKLPPIDYEY